MEATQIIRPELLAFTSEQLTALRPYLWVFGGTALAIIVSVMRSLSPKWPVFIITLLALIAGICASVGMMSRESIALFNGMLAADRYSAFYYVIVLASAAVTVLASFKYLSDEKIQHPEYNIMILFSAIGMMLMAAALDLVVMFIALELMSLSVYVLVGFRRTDRRCNEAAMKYFILGGVASALLLYGVAMMYGATGTTNIRGILSFIQQNSQGATPLFLLGSWLVGIGFLFKVASVPFHMWMPDVYEGAPAPVTGFMTTGLKAAAFAAFIRVFASTGYGAGLAEAIRVDLHDVLWVCAVLTLVVANVIALTQTNLKRLLAYSSISHTGYLLVGMLAGPHSEHGYAPLALYLVSYAAMNLGAFAVLTLLAAKDDGGLNLHDLSGLSKRHPWLSFAMAVFLFSMAGIPPTAGFAAKFYLLFSAVQAKEIPLVVISVLCSAISVYYYLRVLVYMYMREPMENPSVVRKCGWAAIAVASMVFVTLQIGMLPAPLLEAAKRAVSGL